EDWDCRLQLHGQGSDIVQCAWSPDDAMLATCSMDNSVAVWRLPEGLATSSAAGRGGMGTLAPLRRLVGHESWVRGVTWDPVGRYLATASDDGSVIVWRAEEDWGIEARVTAPFAGCDTGTHTRRVDWSPDGKCICATNARQKAMLLTRGSWEFQVNLVGHAATPSIARYSPALYYREGTAASSSSA
ncbi:unnamed protein product, partial [Phaeothamnion confervicola]